MILFREDFIKYPGCILDYNTSNKSAITLATKLRQMGIKNNAFFLVLFDPSLSGVDPFSPDLTKEQMIRIGVECKRNPWYFLREVARAPAQAGNESSPVEFNRSIICIWWCFFNHVTLILTQIRQTGKSFGSDSLLNGLMNFWSSNTKINLLTLSEKLRSETVGRIKNIYDELPAYLKFKTRLDLNNTEELTVKRFKNTYRTHIAQASAKAAYNLGRGLTTPILHVDEGPFQSNISVALDACFPAMDAAVDLAKKFNEPHGVIFTTTAGKKDEVSGKYIYKMITKSNRWTERFYDCENITDLENVLVSNKGVCRVYAEFNHRQLGKTDEWLWGKLREREMSKDAVQRDYFNIWTSGTTTSPIATSIIEKMAKSIVPDEHQDISSIGGFITRWYIPEEEISKFMSTRHTVVGIDTSDGSGGDDLSFVGIDVETGGTVFVGNFNEINLITFSKWLVNWLERFPNCTFVPERRSSAIVIIDYLLDLLPQKGIDPFKRIFNWVVNDPHNHKERYEEYKKPLNRRQEDIYTRCKKYFGFATSGSGETSRTDLYSKTLQSAAKRCSDRILDKMLFEQIAGLVTRNGRIDHDVDSHDDLVIGWLLSHWFLTMGRNLAEYGIDVNKVLINVKTDKVASNPMEQFKMNEQIRLRNRIEELYKLMTHETDSNLVDVYERELKYLDSSIVLADNEHFSVDATIKAAREENKRMKQQFINKPIINNNNPYYNMVLPDNYIML